MLCNILVGLRFTEHVHRGEEAIYAYNLNVEL
jgi:hypothetical protein